uniref:Uncharacterized protein n=1 Tax=Rhizophora mucronata TaxID=61149 RepID=A0A2P2J2B0_RHIMU
MFRFAYTFMSTYFVIMHDSTVKCACEKPVYACLWWDKLELQISHTKDKELVVN